MQFYYEIYMGYFYVFDKYFYSNSSVKKHENKCEINVQKSLLNACIFNTRDVYAHFRVNVNSRFRADIQIVALRRIHTSLIGNIHERPPV